MDGIKIQVDVLAKDAAKELDKFLNNTKFQMLQLETAFKKGTISSADLQKGLVKLEAEVKGYGVSTLKTEATVRALTNANLRAKNEFTSLGGKLNEINANISGKTNPAFISFNQIIQDAPFGIRGVGNNIQFLTQQFTHLRSQGMSTSAILKGMLQNALTPMGGLMLAVSAGTSLLTLAMDYFGNSTEKAEKKANKLNEELARQSELLYELGRITKEQRLNDMEWQIAQATGELHRLQQTQRLSVAGVIGVGMMRGGAGSIITETVGNKEEIAAARTELLQLEVALKNFYETIRKEKEKAGKYSDVKQGGEQNYPMSREEEIKNYGDRQKALFAIDEKTEKLKTELQASGFERREHIAEQAAKKDEKRQKDEQERLRDMQRAYNSMFFDPLVAGFQALGREIFGTQSHVQGLRNTFGNVGAAIIQSLEGVIMKLAETAAMAAILGLLFPGSGLSFGQTFMGLSGLGGSTPAPTPSISGGSNTGVAIAAASRKAQQSRQNVVISGKFVQSGADMVAVVEVNQLKRNTRSMSVSR